MTVELERESFLRQVGGGFFASGLPVGVARAPGRLDVMGGIADYSGSLVLELPIREAAWAAVQLQPEPVIRVVSGDRDVSVRSADLVGVEYAAARAAFRRQPGSEWAAYVAGVVTTLAREGVLRIEGGARMLLDSRVPEGKGVSSSAAIEVATLYALAAAARLDLDPRDAALLCQRTENLVVGAPCGVMDQMTSTCGREGRLLELLCQPATLLGHVSVPREIAFFGVDSGVRHAVSGPGYAGVRVGAFMGRRILGVGGHLADLDPSDVDASDLPQSLLGADFLARYGATGDPATSVDATVTYPVRAPTLHPIHEHHRVRRFAELLRAPLSERTLEQLGELMYDAHASYSACGLGCAATDDLVRRVREAGPAQGLYGARITGGGSGGTVAILGRSDAGAAVRTLAGAAHVFSGSSPGAAQLGTFTLRMDP